MNTRTKEQINEVIAFNRLRGVSTLVTLEELALCYKTVRESRHEFFGEQWRRILVDPKIVWVPHSEMGSNDLDILQDIRTFDNDGFWIVPERPVAGWEHIDELVVDPGYIEYTEYDTA